ncbi:MULTISPECIES: hypothetical protein [Caproicibacterium]|jgi:hypothetical protein|uniref:Uncharacterized protein n=1 Tax=Caproicibacterium lactatifermentans TaxID=2666138 RepID=A0A859DPN4_9FIRM|nr:hypothetical protein [Caproicibacterium lactatifermentans]ARP50592.1 hypothetical protein B6259_06695 [Ruminococcaceae bacterium CPB6]MDD4807470.1 hypothetical protein [Oscillospiraceae bacterium]QKN23666.1 hypothetical protein GJQ69_03740 [Caproicibacterium lactatifermentans]QKO29661.1 hypothetical protein GKP14_00630 [Caproicibacterium lactatifermentans]
MLPTDVIVALIAFAGTAVGSCAGIQKANQMVNFRLKKLENEVEQHNLLVERVAKVEDSTKSAHHRIDEVHEELEMIKNET